MIRCWLAPFGTPETARPPVRSAARGAVAPECAAYSGCADVEECGSAALPPWAEAHTAAQAQGAQLYTDPESGYSVFTAVGLLAQQTCCGSGCRHCPYGYFHTPPSHAKQLPQDAVLLLATPRQRRGRAAQAATSTAAVPVQHTRCVAWALGAQTWPQGTLVVLPFQATGGAVLSLADAAPSSSSNNGVHPHLFELFDVLKAGDGQDAVAVPVADGGDARHAVDAALQRLRLPPLLS